jgi:hypothetical protein
MLGSRETRSGSRVVPEDYGRPLICGPVIRIIVEPGQDPGLVGFGTEKIAYGRSGKDGRGPRRGGAQGLAPGPRQDCVRELSRDGYLVSRIHGDRECRRGSQERHG